MKNAINTRIDALYDVATDKNSVARDHFEEWTLVYDQVRQLQRPIVSRRIRKLLFAGYLLYDRECEYSMAVKILEIYFKEGVPDDDHIDIEDVIQLLIYSYGYAKDWDRSSRFFELLIARVSGQGALHSRICEILRDLTVNASDDETPIGLLSGITEFLDSTCVHKQ
ncbi:MAG: hypothetical protein EON58_15070 [Alphaproteobacteria bacterium]|nr:MAG: hypothetical protein EON58_15070 [Alphaproteobacteria bacterium]